MVWLVIFIVIGFIGLVSVAYAILAPQHEKGGATAIAAGILLLNLSWTVLNMAHIVSAHEVGVIRSFGAITGQIGEGFQVTWPWQTVETWNIRTQVIEPDTSCSNGVEKCMNAGSVDVQDVYVSGVLNIRVSTEAVQELARSVGQSYRDTIVLNRLNQVVKETTAKYKAEDILGNRLEIRSEVTMRMQNEMQAYSINVIDFLITNIDFTTEFKTAIEAKVVAEQDAQREQNRVEISRAQAEQAAATAQGQADRLRIEAEGQAAANRLITESLTPELIQWQAIQKLQDNITIALVPDNGSILQLPSNLFQPAGGN